MGFQKALFSGLIILMAGFLAGCDPTTGLVGDENTRTAKAALELMDRASDVELGQSPEIAAQLGLQANGGDAVIADRSQAAFERARLIRIELLEAFDNLPNGSLNETLQTDLEITRDAYEQAVSIGRFGHGHVSLDRVLPYALDQRTGAYIDIPRELINQAVIETQGDADAYLLRLSALAGAVADEARRLESDAAAGIVLPDFIFPRIAALAMPFQTPELAEHPLLIAFRKKLARSSRLTELEQAKLLTMAENTVAQEIIPSYTQLLETLERTRPASSKDPGIWRLENGPDYYTEILAFYTGSNRSAAEYHDQGLQLVASITGDIDLALQELGLVEGTVGDRLFALGEDPQNIFESSEDGCAELISYLETELDAIRQTAGQILSNPPQAGIRIAPIVDQLRGAVAGGYYLPMPADGAAPAFFYIDLGEMADWPIFTLKTNLYHQVFPGHHFERSAIAASGRLPLIRQFIRTPAYDAGWALYAEDLASELGAYQEDPLSRIGYLQSVLLYAAGMVADTGVHHKRWSRNKAIDYLVSTTGKPRSSMEAEIDQYAVWPGQAVAHMAGRQEILRLRRRAEDVLLSRFSLREFHDVLLGNGPRPFSIVERDLDAWIARKLDNKS
ncbi:MAG: DUF885 family protein [Pseudomonadota bacterium]